MDTAFLMDRGAGIRITEGLLLSNRCESILALENSFPSLFYFTIILPGFVWGQPLKARRIRPAQHGLRVRPLDNAPNKQYGENKDENQKDNHVLSFRLFQPVTPFQGIVLEICQIGSDLPNGKELSDLLRPINKDEDQQANHREEDRAIDAKRSLVVVNQCV